MENSDLHTALLSYDDVIEAAYDIFLEMAQDSLEPADVLLFTAQFDDRGAAEVVETGADWPEHVGFPVEDDTYAEVRIGLVNEANDELDDIFARMLISRDPDNKFCHILWKRD
ncbi:HI1450 family dsDNA-mimic protein [Photobacterium sp. 1_MG-2023]|uniref:HI1450 family dsDNA-mimic protein n=1 Tax=Photobacterium sp. 1_MG-2023 TaxID=3062646 RepID=UPI0026E33B22|nr:HI1450 family dsDNA-mimic protein [Photobacterium sp. 1_MG-2023]MDO6705441.1 HI1450 family dsDNA-mimic protein [Photobacterium sp. 1_MG-2023]